VPDNGPDGRVEVALFETTLFVKVEGLARQDNCIALPDLLEAMISQGCRGAVFEMSECTGMDSTFMGVLAFCADKLKHDAAPRVFVVNIDDRLCTQLKKIGVLPLITVREGRTAVPTLEFKPIEDIHFPDNEQERLLRIKEMHEELIRLNEDNRLQFGEVVRAIEQELGS
jgi:hypothetical protein